MTGESRATIENSPHLEAFRAKGYEVLLLTDPVDEVWVDAVTEFDGKQLQSIAKGQVDLDTEEEKKTPSRARAAAQGLRRPADLDGDARWTRSVKEVRLSSRLTTSPACIVGDAHDITPTLETMYRAMGQELPPSQADPRAQPDPSAGDRAAPGARAERADDDGRLAETAELLYGTAVLAEGGELDRPGPLRPAARRPPGAHPVTRAPQWTLLRQ